MIDLGRRRLGTTDLEITPVGLGSWAIGGPGSEGYGPQDDRDSIAAIHRAVELGINWIDTAPIYGLGHSEEVVGRALAEMPVDERPFVFTKCGLIPDPATPLSRPRRILTPASIRMELEGSLRRLGVERIDLYQFHRPDEIGTSIEDSWGEMGRLIDEGKIRAAGVSNHELPLLEAYEQIRHIDSLQPPFSLVRRETAGLIDWCRDHGVGVLVYSPMQSGLLTDSFTADRAARLPAEDWRRNDPEFQEPRLGRNLALRDALRPIAERHGVTISAVAVGWALAWPGVSGAIVGARRPSQISDWIEAARLSLSPADSAQVATAVQQSGAGQGPTRPG